uniref:Uncharacterized protein n=1 Tax=Rousettus aegyptiacus TaxID=9407 RepID=A0A7J8FJD1_ROUAE|nr:hypothetical protein HJG63_012074 [Rousettus aegyptiacus]
MNKFEVVCCSEQPDETSRWSAAPRLRQASSLRPACRRFCAARLSVPVSVSRSTVGASQCLCSGNPHSTYRWPRSSRAVMLAIRICQREAVKRFLSENGPVYRKNRTCGVHTTVVSGIHGVLGRICT